MAGPNANPADVDPGDLPPVAGDDTGAGDQSGGKVLFTVLCDDATGTYMLIQGDEDDSSGSDTGDVAAGGAGPPGGTTPGTDAGAATAAGEGAPQGQQFDSVGALLQAILALIKDHEATASGQGTEDDNFNAGYTGAATGAPTTKQPPGAMNG